MGKKKKNHDHPPDESSKEKNYGHPPNKSSKGKKNHDHPPDESSTDISKCKHGEPFWYKWGYKRCILEFSVVPCLLWLLEHYHHVIPHYWMYIAPGMIALFGVLLLLLARKCGQTSAFHSWGLDCLIGFGGVNLIYAVCESHAFTTFFHMEAFILG